MVLECLEPMFTEVVVVVHDGGDVPASGTGVVHTGIRKHQPGDEQPRNVGARVALDYEPYLTHFWFLDSDIVVEPDCLAAYEIAMQAAPHGEDRILVGPYEWLPEHVRRPEPSLRNDPRWAMFDASPPDRVFRNDLSAGLACFGGNLIWPVGEFQRVGGFWSELYHGRCEDGELGLRAVAMDVPISMCAQARGWHLWHPRDMAEAVRRNQRDVPMLNARHPWVQGAGVFVIDRDGKAFAVLCTTCSAEVATIEWWEHASSCGHTQTLPVQP